MTNKKRVQPGIPTGGQFASHNRSDSDTTLDERPELTVDAVVASINDGSYFLGDLTYVDYRDMLTDEQQTAYLAGDWETFDSTVLDSFDEQRYMTTIEYAKEAAEKLNLDWADLDDDDQQTIKDAISDKDDSDPTRQLLRNTGSQLLRIPLGRPFYDLDQDEDMEDPASGMHSLNSDDPRGLNSRADAIRGLLTAHSVDVSSPDVEASIRELIANGPFDWHEGVTLDVIVYAGIADAAAAPFSDSDAPGSTGRDLNFTGVRVVLLDPWNGSGHDVLIPGNLSVRVTPEQPATLDSASNGYGWDEVAGVVKSAYAPEQMTNAWVGPAA